MMFAARKLRGIGLIMLFTVAMLIVYPITLNVSAKRAELQRVENEIARVRMQNRMIEGDIAVLANARQLDQWNADNFAFVAPSARQYLRGERALASLDSLRAPSNVAPAQPVLVAQADTPDDADAPAATSAPDAPQAARVAVTDAVVRDMRRTVALAGAATPALPAR